MRWMTYQVASQYTGWSVRYLRNLVSAGCIPVYGQSRSRRFRQDMLDSFLTNRDMAMRKFRLERNTHGD
ncbi:MAG: helix-turn-helix domain-containing protein [Proteobacteria bacterium]|nr:helix-turn-helix domain-containing protein [Pseudomonadota bacterium]